MTRKQLRKIVDDGPPLKSIPEPSSSAVDRLICRLWPVFFILAVVVIGIPAFLLTVAKKPGLLRSGKKTRQAFFGAAFPIVSPMIDWWYRPYKIPLLKQASGVVLDVGSGTGPNLKYLVPARITKLILVEPNPHLWPALRQNVKNAGFREGQYVFCDCGAEEEDKIREKGGVEKGQVDTVTSVLALCSIPDPQRVIASLYAYLKPGGQFLFFEHARSKDASTVAFQNRLTPLWSFLFFGCELNRATDKWITDPYDYDEVHVQTVPKTSAFDHAPKVFGWAQKSRTPQ